tara:strand:+ start:633 stop:1187 length:555 start_codon:yes stop_codon:yes gene_type:complete
MLKYYINFNISFKKYVKDKLNNDIKIKIWEIYKKLIAYDIIERFIIKNIHFCDECNKPDWFINPSTGYYNHYNAPGCIMDTSYITDTHCCEKKICLPNCKFNIVCDNCSIILEDVHLLHQQKDQGWSPVEGKKYISCECWQCSYENFIILTMNNCTDTGGILGKKIKTKNNFIIDNNKRILYNN